MNMKKYELLYDFGGFKAGDIVETESEISGVIAEYVKEIKEPEFEVATPKRKKAGE